MKDAVVVVKVRTMLCRRRASVGRPRPRVQNLPQKRLGREGGEDADEDGDEAAADRAGPSGADQAGPSRDPGAYLLCVPQIIFSTQVRYVVFAEGADKASRSSVASQLAQERSAYTPSLSAGHSQM